MINILLRPNILHRLINNWWEFKIRSSNYKINTLGQSAVQSNWKFLSILQNDQGRSEDKIYTIAYFWKAHFFVWAWPERELFSLDKQITKITLPFLYNSADFSLHLALSLINNNSDKNYFNENSCNLSKGLNINLLYI